MLDIGGRRVSASILQFSGDASQLNRLNVRLRQYLDLTKKNEDEVLNKKGNDLRIQLFKLFYAQKFGGKGKKKIAWKELKDRTKAGRGTYVRQKYLTRAVPFVDKNGRKLSPWQRLVAQETARRQSGIGLLGVTFLQRRWRYKTETKYLATNVSGQLGPLIEIKKDAGVFSITGFTPGLKRIADRYGILGKALNNVSTDIETYLNRKADEAFKKSIAA